MFGKGHKRSPTSEGGQANVPSIIGAGMVIHGDFKSGGALHVDGTVQGDIHVQSLTVGKEATIRGEISAEQVKVHGTVAGCIRAREVVLAASAKVQGDVHHDVLSIEAGAATAANPMAAAMRRPAPARTSPFASPRRRRPSRHPSLLPEARAPRQRLEPGPLGRERPRAAASVMRKRGRPAKVILRVSFSTARTA